MCSKLRGSRPRRADCAMIMVMGEAGKSGIAKARYSSGYHLLHILSV